MRDKCLIPYTYAVWIVRNYAKLVRPVSTMAIVPELYPAISIRPSRCCPSHLTDRCDGDRRVHPTADLPSLPSAQDGRVLSAALPHELAASSPELPGLHLHAAAPFAQVLPQVSPHAQSWSPLLLDDWKRLPVVPVLRQFHWQTLAMPPDDC